MRKILIGILIIAISCCPFVYFSMHQDFVNHSMLGYLLMIVVFSLLAFLGTFFNQSTFVIIGNILSIIISFYFISEMNGNARWDSYFKPLTPYQLLFFVSMLNLIPQFFAMKIAKKVQNKATD